MNCLDALDNIIAFLDGRIKQSEISLRADGKEYPISAIEHRSDIETLKRIKEIVVEQKSKCFESD